MHKICAGFESILEAKKALDKLRSMGYISAHLDIVENSREEFAQEMPYTRKSSMPGLLDLASRSAKYKPSQRLSLLNAASPIMGGFGPHHELPVPVATHLLVTVDNDKADEIKKLLSDFGGIV